jgi:DNA-directed RNA polymerase subunit beta'
LNEVGLPENKAWDLYEPFIVRHLVMGGVPATTAAKAVENKDKLAYNALQEVIKQRPVLINRAPTLHKYSIMAMWPKLSKGKTLQLPPGIVKPLGADHDGDAMSYSVPISSAAVTEAIEKMMPERNLKYVRDRSPTYMPISEYLQGLYLGTKQPTNKPPRRFATKQEAMQAYKKGDLAIDDPIVIQA